VEVPQDLDQLRETQDLDQLRSLMLRDFTSFTWRSMKVRRVGPQAQIMQTVSSSWLCEVEIVSGMFAFGGEG
jgi:hypothetical protein